MKDRQWVRLFFARTASCTALHGRVRDKYCNKILDDCGMKIFFYKIHVLQQTLLWQTWFLFWAHILNVFCWSKFNWTWLVIQVCWQKFPGNVIVYFMCMWRSRNRLEPSKMNANSRACFRQDQFKFPFKITLRARTI